MSKKMYKALLILLLSVFFGQNLYAENRLMFGFGLLFDPNSLGSTIIKDGLDSGAVKTDAQGNYAGQQKVFIAENKLQALENMTGGVFNVKRGGAMTAGTFSTGFEGDIGNNLFFRAGFNYTTKISGGDTKANFLGFTWYDVTWNYHSTVIPVYFGPKFDFKDGEGNTIGGIYIGMGLHWYKAQWGVKGTNNGTALHGITNGLTRDLPVTSDAHDPGLVYDDVVFRASGTGFNWVVGAQSKMGPGYLFLEVETLVSLGMGNGATKTTAGWSALSPYPAYPVTVAGNYYKFGYKLAL
ncbi:MAG: porin OmpL1 [Leptospiraceae bacterium]|nr:porin OmpL1 [Leptospiraceae bacterium]MCP5497688.1 porin OmpL1 [Leptospiraceae bacterium]